MTAITFDRIDWPEIWDMIRAPAYFRRMVEHSDVGRGQSIEQRVADELARRQRVAARLSGVRQESAPAAQRVKLGAKWNPT
jgi:hypothetical protein